jgi:dihydroorotate dehydrogenase
MWDHMRSLLFRLDAETAHEIGLISIRLMHALGGGPNRLLSGRLLSVPPESTRLPEVFGMPFLSRVGLAAGFDKNGLILPALPDLGFGFCEVGTVTPLPQEGNARPRLFRDPVSGSLFNRMGFNNQGALRVAARVAEARLALPSSFRIGVNLGKNRDTPKEKVISDYLAAARPFADLADFLVINVSSPNTPGLRELQRPEFLRPLVGSVRELVDSWMIRPRILLKLAPECLDADFLEELACSAGDWGCDGWVLSNTLGGEYQGAAGGWSGKKVQDPSRQILVRMRKFTSLPIISVGGIMDEDEAHSRVLGGAELVELYSGWVFGGPSLPMRIARKFSQASL